MPEILSLAAIELLLMVRCSSVKADPMIPQSLRGGLSS